MEVPKVRIGYHLTNKYLLNIQVNELPQIHKEKFVPKVSTIIKKTIEIDSQNAEMIKFSTSNDIDNYLLMQM